MAAKPLLESCGVIGCKNPAGAHSMFLQDLWHFRLCCEHAQERIYRSEGLISRLTDLVLNGGSN